MLEIRLNCENCNKSLPNKSNETMMCRYESTSCKKCLVNILINVCTNFGGDFEKRPIRPNSHFTKNPSRKDKVFKPAIEIVYLKENTE